MDDPAKWESIETVRAHVLAAGLVRVEPMVALVEIREVELGVTVGVGSGRVHEVHVLAAVEGHVALERRSLAGSGSNAWTRPPGPHRFDARTV